MPRSLHVIATPEGRVIIAQRRTSDGEQEEKIEFSESILDRLIAALIQAKQRVYGSKVFLIPMSLARVAPTAA